MRTSIITAASVAVLSLAIFAGAATSELPEIPYPKLNVVKAIKAADAFLKNQPQGEGDPCQVQVLSVQWSNAEGFKQPWPSDGTQFHVTEDKEAWSWFLCYATRTEKDEAGKYSAILVLQITEDGKARYLVGTRT